MSRTIVIKYNVTGSRMLRIPIITIYPCDSANIKITFPDIEDINININKNIIITQNMTEPYPYWNLYCNDNIISTKKYVYHNGTITITTNSNECNYIESFKMFYDS